VDTPTEPFIPLHWRMLFEQVLEPLRSQMKAAYAKDQAEWEKLLDERDRLQRNTAGLEAQLDQYRGVLDTVAQEQRRLVREYYDDPNRPTRWQKQIDRDMESPR
jgi:hypothetical protein